MIQHNKVATWLTMAGRLRRFGLAGILVMVLALPAWAQYKPLEDARTAYQDLEYDKALGLFASIASDNEADKGVRKEALRYLGRIQVAKGISEEARKTMMQLLALEPPLVELDPESEPPPLMNVYYEARKDFNVQSGGEDAAYAVPKKDPGLRTIAVMDYRNYAMDDQERYEPMQWGFSSMMIEQLSGAVDLKLIERENLQWLLQEQDLQRDASRVDQATAIRMGKMMGAHAMIFGGIYVNRKEMRLSARVVKVETSEILLGESVQGKTKDFYELLEKLSLKIAQALNSTLTETEIGARTETKSLDAMHAFAQGVGKLDQGDYQAASEKFLEALDLDPSYTRAQRKLESIQIMLTAAPAPDAGSSSPGKTGG